MRPAAVLLSATGSASPKPSALSAEAGTPWLIRYAAHRFRALLRQLEVDCAAARVVRIAGDTQLDRLGGALARLQRLGRLGELIQRGFRQRVHTETEVHRFQVQLAHEIGRFALGTNRRVFGGGRLFVACGSLGIFRIDSPAGAEQCLRLAEPVEFRIRCAAAQFDLVADDAHFRAGLGEDGHQRAQLVEPRYRFGVRIDRNGGVELVRTESCRQIVDEMLALRVAIDGCREGRHPGRVDDDGRD